ncbi:TetR/AcrR family transcriptional regulator [Pseudogemmobacter humi]|uniref:Bacterial regulatory proteins, tetR family n=1 Tax=Pseudogemmobacter humi TaxID=2483812 RepID=A0A3P5XZP7_9RHOB|nr:TetR/AcrR family transcriptional regulator [Pseudogemmobacter humi]VDC33663.1 Bacterial regulatory proteins, tetR family [Pseudogemmobacter humi]
MAERKNPEEPTGWRGSPESWLEAGYEALIEGGIDAVRILPLANRLKLARTSFYWHFRSREDLLAALLSRWDQRTTAPLILATGAYAETEAEALLNVIGCFLSRDQFDDRLEFAVRSWALQDAGVMARVQEADRTRLAALAALLEKWGHATQDAEVRARTIYLVQIGYISMQAQESLAERMARIPHYVEIYSGRARPGPREMARFHARHGYEPEGQS